mgnify:CR=1 FL=1
MKDESTKLLLEAFEVLSTELRDKIDGVHAGLKDEINNVRTELKDEIQGVRTELKDEIQGVRTELKEEINAQALKSFKHIEEVRADLKQDISQVHGRIDDVYGILDKHYSLLETDEMERLALSKQVDRHDEWIQRASKKLNVRYSTSQ